MPGQQDTAANDWRHVLAAVALVAGLVSLGVYLESIRSWFDEWMNPAIDKPLEIHRVSTPAPTITNSVQPPQPEIGMSEAQVQGSAWGPPKAVNEDRSAHGTRAQWVYDRGYIYFDNGRVTTISTQR